MILSIIQHVNHWDGLTYRHNFEEEMNGANPFPNFFQSLHFWFCSKTMHPSEKFNQTSKILSFVTQWKIHLLFMGFGANAERQKLY